ncbi:MAG: hypothetical protein J6R79_05000 [Bacteroidaceae bacterium]|nr:hypothetical protein [Bacteroidaceae bacterium]
MKKLFLWFLAFITSFQVWAFEQDKYYAINRNGESGAYIYASGLMMKTGSMKDNDGSYVWQFIPTENDDCYYIKNVSTNTYVQSTNISLSSTVALGSDPVEYMVSTGAGTTGSGTTYFLASTDQGTINFAEDATLGLNKGANGVVAYYIKTGRGNSYWNITEVNFSPEGPGEPEVEDDDVCPSIAAYRIPCGTYSAATRLSEINITGEGALTELHAKPTTAGRYTLYTQERAVLMPASEVTLSAKLIGADIEGLAITVWADFNGDGVFEQSFKPEVAEQIAITLNVPEVPYQQGRLRIRLDQNGADTPNADFYGTIYDLPFSIGAQQTGRTLCVSSNQEERGTVAIEGREGTEANVDYGTEVTVIAEVKEGYFFHGWRQGRSLISSKAVYTTTMTENKTLVAVFATTEGEAIEEDDATYPVNFPKNTTATRTDRNLNSISLSATGKDKQTISLSGNKVYKNQTRKQEQYFHCLPGEELKADFGYSGSWMHGYVFIDENNDAAFSYKEGDVKQSDTEVKTFSFYSGSFTDATSGYNSAGKAISGSARNTMDCPPFNAPDAPGTYRIRFKVDWNSVDPGGQLAADGTPTGSNGIIANGGFIVDAILQVEDPTGITHVESNLHKDIYTIDGRKLNTNTIKNQAPGVYIVGKKKVMVSR